MAGVVAGGVILVAMVSFTVAGIVTVYWLWRSEDTVTVRLPVVVAVKVVPVEFSVVLIAKRLGLVSLFAAVAAIPAIIIAMVL